MTNDTKYTRRPLGRPKLFYVLLFIFLVQVFICGAGSTFWATLGGASVGWLVGISPEQFQVAFILLVVIFWPMVLFLLGYALTKLFDDLAEWVANLIREANRRALVQTRPRSED